jgi:hypothetical protein
MLTTNGMYEARSDIVTAIRLVLQRYDELRREQRQSLRHAGEAEALVAFLRGSEQLLVEIDDGVIELPAVHGDVAIYKQLAKNLAEGARSSVVNTGAAARLVHALLDYQTRGRLRVAKSGNQGLSLVQFETVIDPSFRKVLILDASASIRELLDYDTSIQVQPVRVSKSYEKVTLRLGDVLSSKDSLSEQSNLEAYLAEVRYLLEHEIPESDDVLIFCLKDVEDSVRELMKELDARREGKVFVAHWGEHRALNQYSHCRWMLTVGVMYLPLGLIASRIIAQTGKLEYDLTDQEIRRVLLSEQAEMLYQAASRGHSRRTIEGSAGPQTIYLFHPTKDAEHVIPLLQEAMPGLRVEHYEPKHLRRNLSPNVHRAEEVSARIQHFLLELREDIAHVATSSLTKELGYASNSRAWRLGLEGALNNSVEWKRDGRRIVMTCPTSWNQ